MWNYCSQGERESQGMLPSGMGSEEKESSMNVMADGKEHHQQRCTRMEEEQGEGTFFIGRLEAEH